MNFNSCGILASVGGVICCAILACFTDCVNGIDPGLWFFTHDFLSPFRDSAISELVCTISEISELVNSLQRILSDFSELFTMSINVHISAQHAGRRSRAAGPGLAGWLRVLAG
jgi:hypothetical protein